MEERKKIGFLLGPVLFLLILFSPILKDNPRAHVLLAIFLLTVVFWVTECIPIPATALLAPVLITIFQVAAVKDAFAPFANPIIMLFLGSFILARAMCVHALDQKLAHAVLSSKAVGGKTSRILLAVGVMVVFFSMWISNTATTAMFFPIAMGMMNAFQSARNGKSRMLPVLFLLSLAYSASIGGIGTPIGSPPNLIAIGFLEKLVGYRITFFQWMVIGFMVLFPMYIFLYGYVRFRMKKEEVAESIDSSKMPRLKFRKGLTRGQINVLIAFSITVILWVLPGFVSLFWGREASLYVWLSRHFPEAVSALIGACLIFFLPVEWKKGRFTLPLNEALNIDWGTLLLFGGGLSLGFQIFDTGLADIIGRLFISLGGDGAGVAIVSLLSITLSVLLTELTSNTATANMIIPIIIAVSQAAGIDPLPPVVGSAIGCSFAFMLPVATPPNAIVYGSGLIPLPKMMKFGFILNIAGIMMIWVVVTFLAPFLGIF